MKLLITVAIAVLAYFAGSAAPVRIAQGAFVDPATRKPFVPRGFNYIRLDRHHSTFAPGRYDPAAAEQALKRWRADGFNVVRVFLNTHAQMPGAIAAKGQAGLNAEYVRNVADFLSRAAENKIGVMITMESFPRVAPFGDALPSLPKEISPANADFLEAAHLQAKARFLKYFIEKLALEKPGCLAAIFSYNLENEFAYQGSPPFTLDSGAITAANGRSYHLPGQRQLLADDAAVHFINQMADAIHQAHPGAMVSASVFTYAAVGKKGPGDFTVEKAGWKNRIPFRPLAILRSKSDFLDVHFYSANSQAFAKDLDSVEFEAVRKLARQLGKPMIVGEFGAFKRSFPEASKAADWVAELAGEFARKGFVGWLYWTYDTHEQSKELWHACDENELIYQKLKRVSQ